MTYTENLIGKSIAEMLGHVPHPGEFVAQELEARGWMQRDLAYILGVPEGAVNLIISGKRGISPEMAKALGDAFDVSPMFFSNMQNAYEMSRARSPDPAIAKRALFQGAYPVREMIKRAGSRIPTCLYWKASLCGFSGVTLSIASPIWHMPPRKRTTLKRHRLNWLGCSASAKFVKKCLLRLTPNLP